MGGERNVTTSLKPAAPSLRILSAHLRPLRLRTRPLLALDLLGCGTAHVSPLAAWLLLRGRGLPRRSCSLTSALCIRNFDLKLVSYYTQGRPPGA